MNFIKIWNTIDRILLGRGRLYLAIYASVALHSIFLVYFFNSGRDWTNMMIVCGPPWVYPRELVIQQQSDELSLRFGDEPGDGEEGESDSDGEGDGQGGFANNPDFDKDKYGDGQWKELVDRLEESSDLRKNFKNSFENIINDGSVDESYIRRKRDYEDITVKEVFPTVKNIDKPFRDEVRDAPQELVLHKERNKIIDLFRNNTEDADLLHLELDVEGEERNKSPLQMPKEERMKYLDRTLTQKKEKQMNDFVSKFMNYDPDNGDLPDFIRDLYYENLQRLAYSFSSDPTYFTIDYFQENLNKEDFLKNSLALYSEFQNKKAGTEILFTLENIYEIQARALALYFQNLQSFPMLSDESKKELRVEVIRRVLEKYKPILKEKNIKSIQDVNRLYTEKRLDILNTLINNTPDNYRVADAKFDKGRVHWEYSMSLEQEERAIEQRKAFKEWASIKEADASNGDFLNQKAWKELNDLLGSPGGKNFGNAKPDNTQTGGMDFNTQNKISAILRNRLNDALNQKKIREDKLLWKKKNLDSDTGKPR
jgi:hypothetical protein